MEKLDLLREQARAAGVPDDETERWIAEFARPCVMMNYDFEGPPGAPIGGISGGRPRLPPDVPLPRLVLLASIDLATFPPGATGLPLPEDGTLLFFADTERLPDRSAYELIHLPSGTPVSERTPPPDDGDWPVGIGTGTLTMCFEPSLPNVAEDSAAHPHGEKLADAWFGVTDLGLLQIGGHLWRFREDLTPGDGWVLLAEFGTEQVFGPEPGYTQWMIRPEDLAARRFDRVRVFFEQIPRHLVYACEFPGFG